MEIRKRGLIGTLIVHMVILLIIIIFGFSTPLPLPAEQGILINFGNSETGSGRFEPRNSPVQNEVTRPTPVPAKTQGEKQIMTQDYEEAPAIEQKTQKPKTTPKKPETAETKPVVKPVEETKPVEKPREVNQRALFPGGKSNTSASNTSQGNTSGSSNQGSLTGSPDSQDYTQGLSSGGDGPSYSLAGRNPQSLPKPNFNYQEEGKVVVEITVDRDGNVTDAIPGVKGSTTLNSYLLDEAKKAALRSKFDRKPDAPAFQKGTVTYYFRLN